MSSDKSPEASPGVTNPTPEAGTVLGADAVRSAVEAAAADRVPAKAEATPQAIVEQEADPRKAAEAGLAGLFNHYYGDLRSSLSKYGGPGPTPELIDKIRRTVVQAKTIGMSDVALSELNTAAKQQFGIADSESLEGRLLSVREQKHGEAAPPDNLPVGEVASVVSSETPAEAPASPEVQRWSGRAARLGVIRERLQELGKLPELASSPDEAERLHAEEEEIRRTMYRQTEATRAFRDRFKEARSHLVAAEKQRKSDPDAYETAKTAYETMRAMYVGKRVLRVVKEQERVATLEAESNREQVGRVERVWRALGDMSLQRYFPKAAERLERTWFGRTLPGKVLIRAINVRTLASIGLLAGAGWVGFGSVAGIGMLALRAPLGSLGTYFGFGGLGEGLVAKWQLVAKDRKKLGAAEELSGVVRGLSEVVEARGKEPPGLGREDLEVSESLRHLEEEMARLEAAALLVGKDILKVPEYQKVRKVYLRYARFLPKVDAGVSFSELNPKKLVDALDEKKEEWRAQYQREAKLRKVLYGVLALFPMTRLVNWALEAMPNVASSVGTPVAEAGTAGRGAASIARAATDAAAKPAAAESAPSLTRAAEVAAAAPQPTAAAEAAPSGGALLPGATAENIMGGGTVRPEGAAADAMGRGAGEAAEAVAPKAAEGAPGAATAVIEEGGNIWKSAMQFVHEGKIAQEDFDKAWANSFVEVNGERVPIHKVALVHAGDTLRFVPGESGSPPRFEVAAGGKGALGTDLDLYREYERLGKEPPEWLKRSVGPEIAGRELPAMPGRDIPSGAPVDSVVPEGGGAPAAASLDISAPVLVDSSPEAAATSGTQGSAPADISGTYEEGGVTAAKEVEAGPAGAGAAAEAGEAAIPFEHEELRKLVREFRAASFSEQSAMLRELKDSLDTDPQAAKELKWDFYEFLLSDEGYRSNGKAFVGLVERLVGRDAAVYRSISGLTMARLKEELDALNFNADSSTETIPTVKLMRQIEHLLDLAGIEEATRRSDTITIDTLLKSNPKRFFTLLTTA